MIRLRTVFVATVVAVATACASKGSTAATQPRIDRNVITEEQIAATKAVDAYTVVRAARPAWLLGRSAGASGRQVTPVVYVDGNRVGGVSQLRQYNAGTVREMRYLSGDDATTQFGTGNAAGAILVFLRR